MAQTDDSPHGVRRHTMPRPGAISGLTAAATLICLLADCTGYGRPNSDERPNTYPDNYKTELLGFLHSYINDPTQIRDAAIADPVLRQVSNVPQERGPGPTGRGDPGDRGGTFFNPGGGPRERYVVCVRYNAKDRDGRYTGIKQGMAVYAGGRFDRFIEQPRGACDQAEYKPFPELQALGR
jgi:hypothetical protein